MHGARAVAVLSAIALLAGGEALGAQDPWFAKAAANVLKVRPYADPSKRFTIDYPAKDWTPYPGGVQSLVTFYQKKGLASVVIERQTLPSFAEQRFVNDTFIGLRAEDVRNADPQSSAIEQRTITEGDFRIAVLGDATGRRRTRKPAHLPHAPGPASLSHCLSRRAGADARLRPGVRPHGGVVCRADRDVGRLSPECLSQQGETDAPADAGVARADPGVADRGAGRGLPRHPGPDRPARLR